jgi:hypothetical protein
MATYNKFQVFVGDLAGKVHDVIGTTPGTDCDTLKVALTNSAPVNTNTVLANITQISGTNGYTTGGAAVTNSGSASSGTVTLTGSKVTWTASGGTVGPFRYVVLYNDTPTSPTDPLIAWWDYGSALTLNDGESFSVKFNNSDTTGTIFTLS